MISSTVWMEQLLSQSLIWSLGTIRFPWQKKAITSPLVWLTRDFAIMPDWILAQIQPYSGPVKSFKTLLASSFRTSEAHSTSVMTSSCMARQKADHDRALKNVFQKFSDVKLTLNISKWEFNKQSLSFFGFVFPKDGISPDPNKVQAIHDMTIPKLASDIRSFLRMATYCAKFIPSFCDTPTPQSDDGPNNISILLRRSKRCWPVRQWFIWSTQEDWNDHKCLSNWPVGNPLSETPGGDERKLLPM